MITVSTIWPALTTFTACSAAFSLCARVPNSSFNNPSSLFAYWCWKLVFLCQFPPVTFSITSLFHQHIIKMPVPLCLTYSHISYTYLHLIVTHICIPYPSSFLPLSSFLAFFWHLPFTVFSWKYIIQELKICKVFRIMNCNCRYNAVKQLDTCN